MAKIIRNGYITSCSDKRLKNHKGRVTNSHGPCLNGSVKTQLHTAGHKGTEFSSPPINIVLLTYLSFAILILFGYVRDFMWRIGLEKSETAVEKKRRGYVPLYQGMENFFNRNIYRRVCDCWNNPIGSVAGAYIDVVDRVSPDNNWHFTMPGSTNRELNMGSYNYLGFAETEGVCHEAAIRSIKEYGGTGVGSSRCELGSLDVHGELEKFIAWYTGTEDSMVVGMGFATNSTCIPSLVGPGCLILSDELNHSSLVLGCRLSGATVRTFRHNDTLHLEQRLEEALETRCRKWKKLLIIVEGVYSMEGTIVDLPAIISLKKRYKAYLYLDEAHSIGSVGAKGRGVVDYYGCDPQDVDIRMGTFTKSFGAMGGFIAGTRALIQHLRRTSHSFTYCTSMSAIVATQIIESGKIIAGLNPKEDGIWRIDRLARNTRYFRRRLHQMGFIVYGSPDSPVVPLLIFLPSKIAAFLRLMARRGVAVVVVGFPATSLLEGRARFCLSAAHDRVMLDYALKAIDQVGDELNLKHCKPLDASLNIEY